MVHLFLQYFGGRGSSGKSGGGGAFGNSARSGHMYEDEYGNVSTYGQRLDFVSQTVPEYNEKEVETVVNDLRDWSSTDYQYIRKAQVNKDAGEPFDADLFDQGQHLEDYISKAPKYSGEIYRGIRLDADKADAVVANLSSGGSIDMLGTASWSSKIDTANDFAWVSDSGVQKGIVFRCAKTSKGTTIQHLSGYGKTEGEVLVSKTARYRAKSITDQGDKWYIEVEEF